MDYDGAPPPAEMAGRKDSVFLPRGTTVRIAVPFRSYADAHAPYMFHCHVLAHEDHGMMGQFRRQRRQWGTRPVRRRPAARLTQAWGRSPSIWSWP